MKKVFKLSFLTMIIGISICLLVGCSEASKVNYNMSKQAD